MEFVSFNILFSFKGSTVTNLPQMLLVHLSEQKISRPILGSLGYKPDFFMFTNCL